MNSGAFQPLTCLSELNPPDNVAILVGSNYELIFNLGALQLVRGPDGSIRPVIDEWLVDEPVPPSSSESDDPDESDEIPVVGVPVMPEVSCKRKYN